MKIIEHGKKQKPPVKATKRFKCIQCGCVFEADDGEYKYTPESMVMFWEGHILQTKYCCLCPECSGGAEEVEA